MPRPNFKKNKGKNLIFVHSLFRTGSTYFWFKFRKQKHIACYYEPLNEQLLERGSCFDYTAAEKLKHEFVKEDYFKEYIGKAKCAKKLNQKLIIDEFCEVKSGKALKTYISCLINSTSKKNVFFKFNRTALRVKWFKQNYTRKSINIYIYRDWRDQWASIIEQNRKGNPYFLIMNVMVASKNLWHDFFRPLDPLVHIPSLARTKGETEKDRFEFNYSFFNNQLNYLSIEEHYLIHYYLWLLSLAYNRKYANICIDMTKLNLDRCYRESVQGLITARTGFEVDFSDINLPGYENYGITISSMKRIERAVEQKLVDSNW